MRTVEETRTRRLQLLEGVLTLPLMYAPAGYGIEACILDALMELAFIDDKVGQLDSELARLRASRLAYPDNHAYGVTSAFRTALPDFATPNREGRLSVEVAAVYAELAWRLGYLAAAESTPSAGAWEAARTAWDTSVLTASAATEILGAPSIVLGSRTHDVALCYGGLKGDWLVLHFKTPERPVDNTHANAWFAAVREGSALVLRWVRNSAQLLDESLVVTPAGAPLSRRGTVLRRFRIDLWESGHPDPFEEVPPSRPPR